MRPNCCIHFNGLMSDTCKADHNYLDVAMPLTQEDLDWHNKNYPNTNPARTGIARRVPCFAENGVKTCPDYREPTPEELRANDEEIARILNRVMTTRQKVVEHIKLNGQEKRNWQNEIPCPICKEGVVIFTYAGAYNGHIHARCSTPNCVQWIE